MTDEEFDALLRRALIDVIHEDYADILEDDPQVPRPSIFEAIRFLKSVRNLPPEE